MKPVTASGMKEIDRFTINKIGIPAIVLMENAGRGVFEEAVKSFGDPAKKKVVVVAGRGGNGGDALVAARYFFKSGAKVAAFLLVLEKELSTEPQLNFKIITNLKIKKQILSKKKINIFKRRVEEADLLIDGIFGFGFKGRATGLIRRVIEVINEARAKNSQIKVVSVDLPSGLDATTGRVAGGAIEADLTVTLGIPKTGLLKSCAGKFVGILKVVDIGLFEKLSLKRPKKNLPDFTVSKEITGLLPRRQWDDHKSRRGRLLIIAGSQNMSGAAILSARAAARSGSGLIYLAVPQPVQKMVVPKIPEIITFGLPATSKGTFSKEAFEALKEKLSQCDAIALGPGLTSEKQTSIFVCRLLEFWQKKFSDKSLLVDADGLNIISANNQWAQNFYRQLHRKKTNLIFTPHAGEFSRLTGQKTTVIQKNRSRLARKFAVKTGVVLVLKGARSVIAGPDGKVYINSSGTPVLATAGSGDVLTGLIGGLLAQKLPALAAARAGVFIHGLAGEIAGEKIGPVGPVASDIVETIPAAYNKILNV
jgi:NAD(P)H-hydrate epimerase